MIFGTPGSYLSPISGLEGDRAGEEWLAWAYVPIVIRAGTEASQLGIWSQATTGSSGEELQFSKKKKSGGIDKREPGERREQRGQEGEVGARHFRG